MSRWPTFVRIAADAMGYECDEPEGEARLEAFAARWGGFGADAMVRAVQYAKSEEWLFSIQLLLASATPLGREATLAFLTNPDPLVRWYSALYLGELKDIRAVPILSAMLTEFLPSPQQYQKQRREQWRYEDARISAAYLLGRLGDPTCIPSLRHALEVVIQIERRQTKPPDETAEIETIHYQNGLRALRRYQDRLVYALGRLGGLGALTGLQGAEDRIPLWRIHLAMGHLHERHAFTNMVAFDEKPALLADLTTLLAQQFGLTPTEQKQDLEQYELKMLSTAASMYDAEEQERRWQIPI